MKDQASFSTAGYATVASEEAPTEYELTMATPVDPSALYVDKPVRNINHRHGNLEDFQTLTWTDTFFDDDDDDIIAVFDFDYEAMESFYTSVGWVSLGVTILYTPIFVASLFGLAPCYLRQNIRWSTRSQHVAITRDGIRFVRDKRPCCWGLPCTDQGKSSKTVPFDKITDCDVEEPAGNSCICIQNVLCKVNVDTASSGTDGRKELKLAGLKDPHTFKKLVWAMKRNQQNQQGGLAAATMIGRGDASQNSNGDDIAGLLREIRDELRANNEAIKSASRASPPDEPAAVVVEADNPKISDC